MKAYYKSLALQRLVVTIDKEKDFPVFFILVAMKILDVARRKKKTPTILNFFFFAKAGILKDLQKSAHLDDNDPFKDLQNQIQMLGGFYSLSAAA